MKKALAAVALATLTGAAHADESMNAYSSPAKVMSAVNDTIHADFVRHNHVCGEGYCADEYVNGGESGNGGAHGTIFYAYAVQPVGHAPYFSYCEPRTGPVCLNRFSASISGASTGVRPPCGLAAG
jgi:hypothetical protein